MNLKTLFKLSLSMLFIIAMLSGVSFAQLSNVYVDVTNGSDSYTGANAVNNPAGSGPKASLDAGLKAVTNGGKIVLLAGTYNGVDGIGGNININSTTYTNITSALTIELRQLNSNNEVKFTAGAFVFNVTGGTLTINSTNGTEFINLVNGNVTLTNGNVSIANSANFQLPATSTINIAGSASFTNAAPKKGTNVTLNYTGGSSITAGPESAYGDYGTGTITVNKTAATSILFPSAITKVGTITLTNGDATFSSAVTTTGSILQAAGNTTFNGAVTTTTGVTLTAGTNVFAGTLTLGTSATTDARLAINGGNATLAAVTFTSTTTTLDDAITVSGTATATFNGNVDVKAGDIVVNSSNNVTFNGNVALGYRDAAASETDIAQVVNNNTGTVAFAGTTTFNSLAKLTVARDYTSTSATLVGGAPIVNNASSGSITFNNVTLAELNTNAAASSSPDANVGAFVDVVNGSTGNLTLGTVTAGFATATTSSFTSATVVKLNAYNLGGGALSLAGDVRSNLVNATTGTVVLSASTTVGGNLTNSAAASGSVTANGPLTVVGVLTNGKALSLGGNNLNLTGAVAHLTNGGTISASTGVVNVNATSSFDGGTFPNVVVASGKVATFMTNASTIAALTLNGDVTANFGVTVLGATTLSTGNLIVANGITFKTLNFTQSGGSATLNGSAVLWVQGDFSRTAGTFTANGTSTLNMKGAVAQNLNGGPLLQLVNLTFDNTTAPIALGQSVRASGTVTITASTALSLSTLNIILNANGAAINNAGSYTAIGGGGVIFGGVNTVVGGAAVTGTTIAGTGSYSYITVDVGAANTVTTASAKVKWNGVLTLKSGDLTVAAGQDFAPTGTTASIIRDVVNSTNGIVAGGINGSFNGDVPTDYDLTYTGTLAGIKTVTAGTSELDLTHVRNLTVSTTTNPLQLLSTAGADVVVKGNVTLSTNALFDLDAVAPFNFEVKGVFTANAGSVLSGSTAAKAFKLSTNGLAHSVIGTVSALSPMTVSGTGVSVAGTAASSFTSAVPNGNNAALQDVVVANNASLTLSNIQRINGSVTTNTGSGLTLGLVAPDLLAGGDGIVYGAITLGGSAATLTSDVTAQAGLTHNKGTFDLGNFKLTMTTAGAYTRAADASAVYPSTTGTLVLNLAGLVLNTNNGSIPNVEVKANTTIGGDVTVSTLLTHTAGQITLANKLIVAGNMTYTAGTYVGATPLQFTGVATKITAAGSFTVPNVEVNSTGTVTFASSSSTTPRSLTITGAFTQTAGTLAIGFNDIIFTDNGVVNATYTRVAGAVTATSTGSNIGEFIFQGGFGNHVITPGVGLVLPNIKVSSVTGISGTDAMTVGNNFYLGANFNMVADSRLAISDGATITRNAGVFDKVPAFGGNALNVIYTGAVTTAKELPAVVNNLTVNADVNLNALVTVNGFLTCAAQFTVTTVSASPAKYPTLGAGASLQMNAGGSITNPVVPTGALNLIYNGVASTTSNDWPATANIGSLKIQAATILHADRTVAGSVTINNAAAANDFDLNGKTFTVQGDVTISGGSNFFINGGVAPARPNINVAPPIANLVFAGNTNTILSLNELKTPAANIRIKLNKTNGSNTVTLVGGSLDFHANGSTLYFGNGLIVTGDNYVKLYAPLFGFGQGFDRTAVAASNTSHIVGNIKKQLVSNGTISGSTEYRVEFPTGSALMYRPAAITFNPGVGGTSTVPNTIITVSHVDNAPTGTVGLPIADGIASGINVSRYPNFYWNLNSAPSSISPSVIFDLELGAAGFNNFINVQNIRTIRRNGTIGDVTNQWLLQGGTSLLSYDNNVINSVPTIVVKNASAGIIAGGSVYTLGLQSNMTVQNPIADKSAKIGDAAIKVVLSSPAVFAGNAGTLTYTAQSSNVSVATVQVAGDTLKVTPVAAGSADISVTATDVNNDFLTNKFKITVSQVTNFTVNGKISYDNTGASALKNVTVTLTPGGLTATTDATGNYSILSVPNGTYTVAAISASIWGGVNATDALNTALYFTGQKTLSALKLAAADVNNDGRVNSTDALLIARRSVRLDSTFAKGDWTFASASVTVNGANTTADIKGICVGDVDGSYTPTGSLSKATLTNEGSVKVNPGAMISVPVKVDAANLAAVSLKIKYAKDLGTFVGVSSKLNGLLSSEENGVVSIAWADLSCKAAVNASGEESILTLNFKPTEGFKAGKSFNVELKEGELATADGKVIANALLKTSSVDAVVPSEFALRQNYPNPFNPTTTIQYDLPVSSKVNLVVFNTLGQVVATLVNGVQEAGTQKVSFNAQNLTSGVYIYKLSVSNGDQKFTQAYKMILMK